MTSTFTWLDASEHDRRRAMDVIDLFQRQTTRDELGLATVRDALAERIAPGISTIQTRARYFLIVPWVYLRLERLGCPSSDVGRRARNNELRIAEALARSSDPVGAMGSQAGRALQRLPSSVYWGGLGALGIRVYPGSQEQYQRSLDGFYRAQARAASFRGDPEAEFLGRANWHPHIPPAPDGFLDELGFALTLEEAHYLRDRFQSRATDSLVAFLTGRGVPFDTTKFPWEDVLFETYPEPLRGWIEHARCFSEVMNGAALLYNLMLSEARGREDWVETYEKQLARWQAMLGERGPAHASWERAHFWALVESGSGRIPIATRHFVTQWIALVLDARPLEIGTDAQRTLVRDRESMLKRGRARLLYPEYLQLYSGSAGADPLDYRWPTVQTIANDILRGLSGQRADAAAA